MLGFIGCGVMGTTLIEGITAKGLLNAEQIVVYDLDTGKTGHLKERLGVTVVNDIASVCRSAAKIIIAVKPRDIDDLLPELKPCLTPGHILISVAAGLSIDYYQTRLEEELKIMRVMPNTPCLVGEGMIVTSKNERVSSSEEREVTLLLEPLGKVIAVEDSLMDAVTGLSGSGPAYVLLFIEALADGGVEMGLGRETALLLSAQTVLGTAKMFLQTGEHPAAMKNMVTSPGGTTSAGLLSLERGAVRSSIIKAVTEAAERSRRLGS